MNKYFCSFVVGNEFRNCIFYWDRMITTYDDIFQVEKKIQQCENCETLPIIINYRRVYEQ